MALIAWYLITAFVLAAILGLWRYKATIWNFVDVIYYPLAGIGVALLFANTDTQRQLLEVTRLADERKAALQAIDASKPDVRVMTSEGLFEASLDSIELVAGWRSLCSGALAPDPKCLAVEGLIEHLDRFIQTANSEYPSQELRLSAVCAAADQMLSDIRSHEAISSLVADELIAQYKLAVSKNLAPLDYEAVNAEVEAFKQRALGQVDKIHRLAFQSEDESSKLVLEIRRAEVGFSESILSGLYPCIVAPKRELDALAQWTQSKRTLEQDVQEIEADRQRLKDTSVADPRLLWIQLNLWPLVLITALSLKFAKGMATLRKACGEEATEGSLPPPSPALDHQDPPVSGSST